MSLNKILVIGALILLSLPTFGQEFILIDETNKVQRTTPVKSFRYGSEVILKPDFSVAASTVPTGAWYCRSGAGPNSPLDDHYNFISTEVILKKGITDENQIWQLLPENKSTSYSYSDGLGRPLQTVSVQSSPTKKDAIAFKIYDAFGREIKSYLPFTYDNAGNFGAFKTQPEVLQAAYYTSGSPSNPANVATNTIPYSTATYDDSPLNRVKQTFGPGSEWQAANRFTKSDTRVNTAGEVRLWTFSGTGFPQTIADLNNPNSTHRPNSLMVTEFTDEEGFVTRSFKDFRGQLVLERKGKETTWFDTYYIYDVSGNVVFIFPPEAVNRVYQTNSEYIGKVETVQQAFLDLWCFQYKYNQYGLVSDKRVPGSGWVFMLYDKWDRQCMTQDANQRATDQWTFTKYDIYNRPVLTGFATGTRSSIELALTNSNVRYETRTTDAIGYTNTAYPSHTTANLLSITYYDDYNFLNNSGWDAEALNYAFVPEGGFESSNFASVKGLTTGGKVKKLGSDTWLNSVSYYDPKYQTIQVISENHLGGSDRISSLYHFSGKLLSSKRSHDSPGNSLTILEEYTYDHAQRALNTYHQINNGPKILMLTNKYNELGQLVEKNIHSTDEGVNYLQSVDTRYNIRGWITNINNSALSNDGIKNNDTGDLFGMEMSYFNPTVTIENGATDFTTKQFYDGNIAAIKWKTDTKQVGVTPQERIYGFGYDGFSRFRNAYYATNNAGNWNGNSSNFNESISGYDANGNIGGNVSGVGVGLSRQGTSNNQSAVKIDDLTYTYTGNRLTEVSDGGNTDGFTNRVAASDEYKYYPNGNLKEDLNKEVTLVLYNHLNMPTEIRFLQNGVTNKIEYTYAASGNKLSKTVWMNGVVKWTTNYVGAIQFDNGKLSFMGTAEGRAVNNGNGFDYEYFYKDHQNNIRLVYGSLKETATYLATNELNLASTEQYESNNITGFNNLSSRRINPGQTSLNVTPPSDKVSVPNRSAKVNASSTINQPVGPGKKIRVLNGDAIYAEVFAKYTTAPGNTNVLGATALGTAVNSAFGITLAENATLYNSINANAASAGSSEAASNQKPKAYLVVLFFDDNYVYQPHKSNADGIKSLSPGQFEKLSRSFTADRNGYVYIYVASESTAPSADVYFDDLYIVHQKTTSALQVLQASDYYPYGLSFNEYQADRLTETSAGVFEPSLRNRYLFQGQELQKDLGLGWYHYKYRMHDPSIGRFGGVDPLSEKYLYNSTFAFSENRLTNGIELEGAELQTSFAAPIAGFTASYNYYQEKNWDSWDGGYVSGAWNMAGDAIWGRLNTYADAFRGTSNFVKEQRAYSSNQGVYSQDTREDLAIPEKTAQLMHFNKQAKNFIQAGNGYNAILGDATSAIGLAMGGENTGISMLSRLSRMPKIGIGTTGNRFVFGSDARTMEVSSNLRTGILDDVVVHGRAYDFVIDGTSVSPQQLGERMIAQGYRPGTPIRLVSCWTGVQNDGAAFQLSQYLKTYIQAPTNEVGALKNGSTFILGNGSWEYFNVIK